MQPSTEPPPARGDEDELYRRHHRHLLSAVASVVRAPDALIEDACQMAWMTLLRCQPDRDHVFGWLRRVAINEAYRLSAIARREPGYDPTAAIAVLIDEDGASFDRHLEARQALAILARLPERQRRDLTLLAAGYSYKEIQALTADRTRTNVNKSLRKARARIRLERLRTASGLAPRQDKGAKSRRSSSQ
jgi:RNA polymerase sigma factor (sigma-70 family)